MHPSYKSRHFFVCFPVLVHCEFLSVLPQQLQTKPSLTHGQPPSEHQQSSSWYANIPVCPFTGGRPDLFLALSQPSPSNRFATMSFFSFAFLPVAPFFGLDI